MEPIPADLSGLTLAKTVKRFVLEDPKLCQLQTRMHRDCPGWSKSVSSSWWNPAHAPWRVKFENWDTPEERALSWKYGYRTLDQPSYVPEQVTAVCRRFLGRLASLIRWLQDGSLIAVGTKEPPTDELARKPINAGWWSRDDVEVNFEKGKLLRIVDHKPVLVFSNIRVWRPEDVAFDTGRQHPPEKKKPCAPLKGKPGRTPKWDWDGAGRELMMLANSPDGLPYPQAAIEKHLSDWFMERCGDHPSESHIRKEVVKRLPPNYHDRK